MLSWKIQSERKDMESKTSNKFYGEFLRMRFKGYVQCELNTLNKGILSSKCREGLQYKTGKCK